MSDQTSNHRRLPMGRTEQSWCKAVSCGTGTTVLALQLSKSPNISLLQNTLQKLQISHPILSSKLHYDATAAATAKFSLIIPTPPPISFSLLQPSSVNINHRLIINPLQIILEHEMNINPWSISDLISSGSNGVPVFFCTVYELPESNWAVFLRLHTAVCDRTTAVSLLTEMKELMMEKRTRVETEISCFGKVNFGIENLVPVGKGNKGLWAHGLNVLGYSLNSLRLTNLKFENVLGPRSSQLLRLRFTLQETTQLLQECKKRGIKLCGALAAAGMMATHSGPPIIEDPLRYKCHNRNKYAVVTLTDCRSELNPPLTSQDFGFYHSAILSIHIVKRDETVWELAKRIYTSLVNSKLSNKHFTDMSDLNFLMCKAIENPSLTPSSTLRTSLMCVFEETVVDNSGPAESQFGLDDFIGCASVHGVGPSIAVFDTIRNGALDVVCVYPSPLHSREQMGWIAAEMKRVLVESSRVVEV